MDRIKLYNHIDWKLEKLVFLVCIEEGLYGLWELVQTVNQYEFLTLVDKYAVAYDLLKEILAEDLARLEEFNDSSLTSKIREIAFPDIMVVLDNPRSWDLNGEPAYSLSIMEKGVNYLDNLDSNELDKLGDRLLTAY